MTLVDETVYGTISNYGTVDVETAGVSPHGALFDGASVTNFAAADGIEVVAGATLTLDDSAVISGGMLTVDAGGALAITRIPRARRLTASLLTMTAPALAPTPAFTWRLARS